MKAVVVSDLHGNWEALRALQREIARRRCVPGAKATDNVSLVLMAKYPKYRSHEHIKITPLYIDFRMNWSTAR